MNWEHKIEFHEDSSMSVTLLFKGEVVFYIKTKTIEELDEALARVPQLIMEETKKEKGV